MIFLVKLEKLSAKRVNEIDQWIGEHGAHDHMGRPFKRTITAQNMRRFNYDLNIKCQDVIKHLSREFH